VELAIRKLPTFKNVAAKVLVFEVIINGFYYNAPLMMKILEVKAWTQSVFVMWFQLIPKMQRTHDKKISILAFCALMSLPTNLLPPLITQELDKILGAVIKLQQDLEVQRKEIEEREKEEDAEEEEDDDDEDEEKELEDDNEGEPSADQLKSLIDQIATAEDDQEDSEDDDIDDEDEIDDEEFETAIDNIDELVVFMETIKSLAARDGALYQKLMQHQDQTSQALFQDLMRQAEIRKMQPKEEKK